MSKPALTAVEQIFHVSPEQVQASLREILDDPKLLDRHAFLEGFVPAMRIAMERDRLHCDLLEKIDQPKASRLRIVEAAAYYVCAEAVTNAIKHAQCSRVG